MAVRSIRRSVSWRPSQRERLRRSRARFTSPSTNQETGATLLYHGHWVFSEWQLTQAWANTSATDEGRSAPGSRGAWVRSDASCERECTDTDARSHTSSKVATANLVPVPRLKRVGVGRPGFVGVRLTPS